jgi:hypothetical protein
LRTCFGRCAETRRWLRRLELGITEPGANGFRFAEGLAMFKDRLFTIPEAAPGLKAMSANYLKKFDGQLVAWVRQPLHPRGHRARLRADSSRASPGRPVAEEHLGLVRAGRQAPERRVEPAPGREGRRHARLGSDGQADYELAAAAETRAVGRHRPTVHLDQTLHERQPDAETAARVIAVVQLREHPEYLPQLVGCDADALVSHPDHRMLLFLSER